MPSSLRAKTRAGLAQTSTMRNPTLTIPELMFVVGTRAMLGAGVALLASNKLSKKQRKTAGRVLLATGAITSIPAAFAVLGKK